MTPRYAEQAAAGLKSARSFAYSRARAADVLGWTPEVDLETGLKRMMDWRLADIRREG